jgi:hypothetical protein
MRVVNIANVINEIEVDVTRCCCALTAAITYRIEDLAAIRGSEAERRVWVQGEGFLHGLAWGKIGETLKLH